MKGATANVGYTGIISDSLACRLSDSPQQRSIPRRKYGTRSYLQDNLNSGGNIRGLEIENRTAALFGIEERSPFYDRRVIEFAFRIPEEQRSEAEGKFVLREAMKGQLPEAIRQRRDKAEFSAVLARSLLMPDIREALACPTLVAHGWVDPARIHHAFTRMESEYRDGGSGYGRYGWPLWMAFCLEQTCDAIMQAR